MTRPGRVEKRSQGEIRETCHFHARLAQPDRGAGRAILKEKPGWPRHFPAILKETDRPVPGISVIGHFDFWPARNCSSGGGKKFLHAGTGANPIPPQPVKFIVFKASSRAQGQIQICGGQLLDDQDFLPIRLFPEIKGPPGMFIQAIPHDLSSHSRIISVNEKVAIVQDLIGGDGWWIFFALSDSVQGKVVDLEHGYDLCGFCGSFGFHGLAWQSRFTVMMRWKVWFGWGYGERVWPGTEQVGRSWTRLIE